MQIATWNVNGIRARAQRLAEWLSERQPDVVCLQELKVVESSFPFDDVRALGYHAVLAGQPAWNGVAVLAKEPPALLCAELPGAEDAGARFVGARVYDIDFFSVYVPNGKSVAHPDYEKKLAWLDRLGAYLRERTRLTTEPPLVVGGDFNVCPTPLDSHGGADFDGHIFHTVDERRRINDVSHSGLIDLYRRQRPNEPGFSWWDYRAGSFPKNEGLRIDMLFASHAIAARVSDVFVDREFRKKGPTGSTPSDHAPVVATLT